MRMAMLVAALAVALVVVMMTTSLISSVVGPGGLQARNLGCIATIGPLGDGGDGAAQATNLNEEQRRNAALIISIGKQRNLPTLAWQVALQAAMTESGLRNLGYGDRDSLGLFQMRPSQNWGTPAQVTDLVYEINKFYDVLNTVSNWQNQAPGDSAQDVERSAFPQRYHQWQYLAAALVKSLGQVADPTGCGAFNGKLLPAPTGAATAAIQFALAQLGKPYLWGATGPDTYDCSGLVLRAYQAAGVKLDRTSRDQFHNGAYLPVSQAQPGDLMFWAYDPSNPATIHHVAIYLGNNQIVEAPENGIPVRTHLTTFNSKELVPQAVRPGV